MTTREDLLGMAASCLRRVHDSQGYNLNEAQAMRLQALAEAGRGLIELAKELREGLDK